MKLKDIIIKPVITEKATSQGDNLNKYSFIVNKKANKLQIKKAIEGLYNVKVNKVNTVIYPGTPKKRYTKLGVIEGKTSSYKKAIITLKEGDKIDFFSNI